MMGGFCLPLLREIQNFRAGTLASKSSAAAHPVGWSSPADLDDCLKCACAASKSTARIPHRDRTLVGQERDVMGPNDMVRLPNIRVALGIAKP